MLLLSRVVPARVWEYIAEEGLRWDYVAELVRIFLTNSVP